jgi:hypothetical protein
MKYTWKVILFLPKTLYVADWQAVSLRRVTAPESIDGHCSDRPPQCCPGHRSPSHRPGSRAPRPPPPGPGASTTAWAAPSPAAPSRSRLLGGVVSTLASLAERGAPGETGDGGVLARHRNRRKGQTNNESLNRTPPVRLLGNAGVARPAGEVAGISGDQAWEGTAEQSSAIGAVADASDHSAVPPCAGGVWGADKSEGLTAVMSVSSRPAPSCWRVSIATRAGSERGSLRTISRVRIFVVDQIPHERSS